MSQGAIARRTLLVECGEVVDSVDDARRRDGADGEVGVLEPEPRRQRAGIRAADRDPL